MSTRSDIAGLCKEAKSWVRHKDYARALQIYDKALALNEASVEVHEGAGAAHFLAQNYEKAIEHFTRITQLIPTRATAFVNIGAVYNRMGEFQQAVGACRKAIQRDKRSAQAFYNLGIAHRGLNQLSMAVSAYREALRLEPEMVEAHQNLANVYLDMQNFHQAVTHYRRALEIKPNFDRAKRGLAKAEAATTKARAAVSPFGRLVDEGKLADKSDTLPTRELSHQERFEDRQEVHRCAVEMERFGNAFLIRLKDNLEQALLALDRAVTHGAEAPQVITRAHQEFHDAFEECQQLREGFRRKVLELRAHEESINKPDSNDPE